MTNAASALVVTPERRLYAEEAPKRGVYDQQDSSVAKLRRFEFIRDPFSGRRDHDGRVENFPGFAPSN